MVFCGPRSWRDKFFGTGASHVHTYKAALNPKFDIQVPSIGNFGLIDLDTPKDVYTRRSIRDNSPMLLVFSDEFNMDGRSFYPGDDPYWEAEDLHYWVSNIILVRYFRLNGTVIGYKQLGMVQSRHGDDRGRVSGNHVLRKVQPRPQLSRWWVDHFYWDP